MIVMGPGRGSLLYPFQPPSLAVTQTPKAKYFLGEFFLIFFVFPSNLVFNACKHWIWIFVRIP